MMPKNNIPRRSRPKPSTSEESTMDALTMNFRLMWISYRLPGFPKSSLGEFGTERGVRTWATHHLRYSRSKDPHKDVVIVDAGKDWETPDGRMWIEEIDH